MHFTLEWTEGLGGILEGRKIGPGEMPPGVMIESIDLRMKVMVGSEWVADYYLPLDTIGLGSVPSMTFVDITDVPWDSVFVDIDEEEARLIYEAGFQLSAPLIIRVVFRYEPPDEVQVGAVEESIPPIDPPGWTVIIPNIELWIDCCERSGKRTASTGDGSGKDKRSRHSGEKEANEKEKKRGDEPSRGGRGSTSDKNGAIDIGEWLSAVDGEDNDDDEEDRLLPAAIAGVVVIGGLAIAGGTLGYFGSASKAPIGLMSGYIEPRGGLLFQAAINKQVFGEAEGPENLILSLTGFYNVFNFPIQPAIGLGARRTEEKTDGLIWKPSVSVGVVGNFGRFVLLAGYDVATPDFRFGIGINFRHKN